jgi:hypothetical protein
MERLVMPQRSNLFQHLVHNIYESMRHEWNVITESAMMLHSITGRMREVDIKVEASLCGETIILSIECCDRSRISDVTWVEAMLKKHEFLTTKKLILWSRSGFTRDALEVAKFHGVTCISPQNEDDVDWARLGKELKDGFVKHVIPKYHAFIDCEGADSEKFRIEADAVNVDILDGQGAILGSSHIIFDQMKSHPMVGTTLLDHARPDYGDFYLERPPQGEWYATDREGKQGKIFRFGLGVKATVEEGKISTASALHTDKLFTLASSDLNSGTLEITIEETAGSDPRISGAHIPKGSIRVKSVWPS